MNLFCFVQFAAGDWIGIELDQPEGKNDGSVNGVRYFDCQENHGLFVKKAQVWSLGGVCAFGCFANSSGLTAAD